MDTTGQESCTNCPYKRRLRKDCATLVSSTVRCSKCLPVNHLYDVELCPTAVRVLSAGAYQVSELPRECVLVLGQGSSWPAHPESYTGFRDDGFPIWGADVSSTVIEGFSAPVLTKRIGRMRP